MGYGCYWVWNEVFRPLNDIIIIFIFFILFFFIIIIYLILLEVRKTEKFVWSWQIFAWVLELHIDIFS